MGPEFVHLRKEVQMHGWIRYLLGFLAARILDWLRICSVPCRSSQPTSGCCEFLGGLCAPCLLVTQVLGPAGAFSMWHSIDPDMETRFLGNAWIINQTYSHSVFVEYVVAFLWRIWRWVEDGFPSGYTDSLGFDMSHSHTYTIYGHHIQGHLHLLCILQHPLTICPLFPFLPFLEFQGKTHSPSFFFFMLSSFWMQTLSLFLAPHIVPGWS